MCDMVSANTELFYIIYNTISLICARKDCPGHWILSVQGVTRVTRTIYVSTKSNHQIPSYGFLFDFIV